MNRHTHSFLITLACYLSVAGFIVYASSDENYCEKKSLDTSAARVCFSVISREAPVQTPAPKEQKKVEKKKVVKKREVVKNVKKEVKQVVQKEALSEVPTQEVLEEVAQEDVPEVVEEPVEMEEFAESEKDVTETMEKSTPQSDRAAVANIQKEIDSELMQARQDLFMASLTKKINSNKSYPRSARRRGIEGNVEVEFEVYSDGNVDNITVASGKKVFKRSAIEAITKSFPIEVESTLFDFPYHFNVTLAYALK
ncbi:MAG: energy transducer TonB [Helicobacteraceae bacterium]|jgi:protein TonB|nr:energy transducer TonB [Helicobacteraceae bacterium]